MIYAPSPLASPKTASSSKQTDPFLAPQQVRGKRNEPAFLVYINEKLAALRGVSPEAMARQTSENAEQLFDLD